MKRKQTLATMACRLALGGAIGLACASCTSVDYQEGVHRAETELHSGSPCIYSISAADQGRTDPRSGLPILVLGPVTPELAQMIEGHNKTIYANYH